jgi:hypothetical protein
MTIRKLSCAAILTAAFAATALGGAPARAGVITLDVSATFSPVPPPGMCSPTCTLSGDIVINNSSGVANNGFVSADVTASGFSPPGIGGPFTSLIVLQSSTNFANTDLTLGPVPVVLIFETPTAGSFVGYTGGPLATVLTINPSDFHFTSGSLTPAAAAVPEPPSLLLLLSALVGLGSLLCPRSLRRTA